MYSILRPLLFSFPAESSHNFSLKALDVLNRANASALVAKLAHKQKPVSVMGLDFPNAVGMAAGLDKNGRYIDALSALGFGSIEIGTVTPRAQPGNAKPRLFRLKQSRAIINRMGFNNHGVDYLINQVKAARYKGILGINIGKNFDTPVAKAADDYLFCMDKVYQYSSYITVNISSPNTPGLRSLQYGEELSLLIQTLKQRQKALAEQHERYVPIALKVAPDLSHEEIEGIADVLLAHDVDGLIATNTTLSREKVTTEALRAEQGGLSGEPLKDASTKVIGQFSEILQNRVPIIGVGGIASAADAQEKLAAGASLIQLYTGFIYKGPDLVRETVEACAEI